jgi:hypothetical protein
LPASAANAAARLPPLLAEARQTVSAISTRRVHDRPLWLNAGQPTLAARQLLIALLETASRRTGFDSDNYEVGESLERADPPGRPMAIKGAARKAERNAQ